MKSCHKAQSIDTLSSNEPICQVLDLQNPLWQQVLSRLRHDIYHLPAYVALEAQRIKAIPEAILITKDDKVFFVPYLLRSCDDLLPTSQTQIELFDVISPYGYPGILLNEAANNPDFLNFAINEFTHQLSRKNVCSAFLRLHPLLNQNLSEYPYSKINGETVAVDLRLSLAEIWSQTRPEHRNKINKCKRAGMIAKIVPFVAYIDDFIDIYEQTMDRVGASSSYYFDKSYFIQLSQALKNQLHLCIVELDNEIICSGLFTEACGIVQYHLGGTKSAFLKQAPSKLMFDYVRTWAKERNNEFLHLGGGVGSAKDSLFHFKAGFSKQTQTFSTIRLVVNKKKYHNLVQKRAAELNISFEELLNSEFFPAYRCS
ncbi:GNAT family N-acetyltransferase [Gloeocapsopsis sp. IPPAS B-1203]|uniref:GNAT family N-acetyltransferase n=1 Tax=Gloeocapsopsis sp. IPPAS B-1203 TaxID=2049454 RepID=UPI000C198DB0|nr:GNAT family N-acetyltransferase [Gloeocapsopsis sp. IPPAS B-1203]PIG91483.1 FemAB family protein [Gloeocapsopsis sp. IPPAS B-1203]